MVILITTPRVERANEWRDLLVARMPGADVRVWPEVGDPAQVDVVLSWKAPAGVMAQLPNLRLVCSLGMGVDHVLNDPGVSPHVPIVRLVDPNMIDQMSEYVVYGVLHYHRRFDVYDRFQRERRWEELPLPHTASRHVGVLGLGTIGTPCARRLLALGFSVSGWSRSPRREPGIRCHHGAEGLQPFLANCEILVCVLPLTASTAGIVDARLLAQLPRGAYLINVARGGLVDEEALLAALDAGQLAGAMLDVTQVEPLPQDHPLWRHPAVRITPHIAGLTNAPTAIATIVENLRRWQTGEPLLHLVERARGY